MMMATMLPLKVKVVQSANYIWAVPLLCYTAHILTNVMTMMTITIIMMMMVMIVIVKHNV